MALFKEELIPVEKIIVKDRARKFYEGIEDLALSIAEHGLLNPILVTENYQLLGGGRRLTAFKHLNKSEIPCRVMIGLTEEDYEIIEYIENHERKDFLWHEELELKATMHTKWMSMNKDWGQRETAKRLRVSLGGLNSDLEMARIINVFPELKYCETKGKAREAFKKLDNHAASIAAMKNMGEDDKKLLKKLLGKTDEGETDNGNVQEGVKQAVQGDQNNSEGDTTCPPAVPGITPVSRPSFIYRTCHWKELSNEIPPNSVGFAELDPPYAIGFDSTGIYANAVAKESDWTPEKFWAEMNDLLPTLYDKLINCSWVLCWCGREYISDINKLAASIGFKTQNSGVWMKEGGSSIRPNQVMVSNYETYVILAKGPALFNTKSFKSAIYMPTLPFSEKSHQWEKPRELYQLFFNAMKREQSIFWSPFAGSGNSMLVAASNNMIPIGSDLEPKYRYSFNQRFNEIYGE